MLFRFMRVLLLICVVLTGNVVGQDSTTVNVLPGDSAIKASVRVGSSEVPLNRTLSFVLEVSWQGDLNRYQIEEVETPILSNLEIVGNASSNRVADIGGVAQAIRTFEFELKPIALGMAYIDGTMVSYRDQSTDKVHRLMTNRLQVEVVEAVRDSRSMRWALIAFGFTGVLLFAVGYFIIRKKRSDKTSWACSMTFSEIPCRSISTAISLLFTSGTGI